jgi:cysteinyl-tRNA synthetase
MERRLLLYNTASRQKEPFTPAHDEVGMYCCGPTVYNYAHIGNLRSYIFEDVVKRLLLSLGYKVKHVMNITDVGHLTSDADTGDDKMEKGAAREGKSVWDIAAYYTDVFRRNMRDLNISEPTLWVKATDHIPQMIAMVKQLEEKGFTYRTPDGIYFDTTKFPSYADFAKLDVESLRAGSRVDMGGKKSVTDFALWKFSPKDIKRQMEWDSPWGIGFPGWHIECSAMSLAYLPQPIDIHCGGQDHVRVHHTNEIAQAEAATGKKFVNYWLHGEFLVIDKGKMAKSGEGFVTLDSVKNEGLSPLAYRMFCYSAHYRSPLMFSWEGLRAAAQGLANMKKLIASEATFEVIRNWLQDKTKPSVNEKADSLLAPFWDALCDDCNMPVAMGALWNLLRDKSVAAADKCAAIDRADSVLALDLLKPDDEAKFVIKHETYEIVSTKELEPQKTEKIIALLNARIAAKVRKDYSGADAVRGQLKGMGVEVKDLPGGKSQCTVVEN